MKTVIVTGSAGFIGYHITQQLLNDGFKVVGIDCLSDYYDINLKKSRLSLLKQSNNFIEINERIERKDFLSSIFHEYKPDVVIHLAAQAGVRYSLENPRAYIESNLVGTFELLEASKNHIPKHLLIASTSSAYGANKRMPFRETDKADHQVSFYASTKKSTEIMAHSYSHLFNIPITVFRFFTVYGPWGRPDMAPYKFTKAIFNNEPIDIYNYGNMKRDFTYIDDLVKGITLLMKKAPNLTKDKSSKIDSISSVAPYRLVNIGNSKPISLNKFISAIENSIGKSAIRNEMPIQAGDVVETWADITLFKELTGYVPQTNLDDGIHKFVLWYKDYYGNMDPSI